MPQYLSAITDHWQLSLMWTIFPDMSIDVAGEAVSLMQLLTLVTFSIENLSLSGLTLCFYGDFLFHYVIKQNRFPLCSFPAFLFQ